MLEHHLMTRCLVLTPRNGKCRRRRWKVEEDQQFSQDDQRPAKIQKCTCKILSEAPSPCDSAEVSTLYPLRQTGTME